MEGNALNLTQLHLLKVFSFAKDETTLNEIKEVLSEYFAQKVEHEMDKLWEKGEWNQEINEKMLVIKDMAKMLYEQGIPLEVIAERFNLDSELLKSLLK